MDKIEKAEVKVAKLHSEIDLLEKQISLRDTEQIEMLSNDQSELKKNAFEIKQLRIAVEDLQARLKRPMLDYGEVMSGLNSLQDAQQGKLRKTLKKGQSIEEMTQLIGPRILELKREKSSLSKRLKWVEYALKDSEEAFEAINNICRKDELTSEADCVQYIKYLESEHLKAIKDIAESEEARQKMKRMLEILQKRQQSHFRLLMDLKKETSKMKTDDDENVAEKVEKEAETEPKRLLKDLETKIEQFKDVTGCYDVRDADVLFREQKTIHDDLQDIKMKAGRRLEELKDEKRELASRRASLKAADVFYPKRNEELAVAKNRLKEQESRCDSAKAELDRLNTVTSCIKDIFQRLNSRLRQVVNTDNTMGSIQMQDEGNVVHLGKELENTVKLAFLSSSNKTSHFDE